MKLNIFNLISYGQLQLPLLEYSITVDFNLKDDITDSTIQRMIILELRNDPGNLECPRECVQLEVALYTNFVPSLGTLRQYLGVRRMHS